MVDQRQASAVEHRVLKLLTDCPKLNKYALALHGESRFGIDIQPGAEKYKGLAIEVENTEAPWPDVAPYPPSWVRGFTVPTRKLKFYAEHPLSIYVKVNTTMTRAAVAPMSYICASETMHNQNKEQLNFKNNDFFVIRDPEHPAICYCSIADMPSVVASQLDILYKLGNLNKKYTDDRPKFRQQKEK